MKNVKELFTLRKANRSALFFLLLSCAIGNGYSKALPAEGGVYSHLRLYSKIVR